MYFNCIVHYHLRRLILNWLSMHIVHNICLKTTNKTQGFTLCFNPPSLPIFKNWKRSLIPKKNSFKTILDAASSYVHINSLSFVQFDKLTHIHTLAHTIHNLSPSYYLSIYLTPTHTHNYPIFWPYLMHTNTLTHNL